MKSGVQDKIRTVWGWILSHLWGSHEGSRRQHVWRLLLGRREDVVRLLKAWISRILTDPQPQVRLALSLQQPAGKWAGLYCWVAAPNWAACHRWGHSLAPQMELTPSGAEPGWSRKQRSNRWSTGFSWGITNTTRYSCPRYHHLHVSCKFTEILGSWRTKVVCVYRLAVDFEGAERMTGRSYALGGVVLIKITEISMRCTKTDYSKGLKIL